MSLLFGGLIVSAFWIAPAKSADGPITLRVPVELKKMIAVSVRVGCSIRGDDQSSYLGIAYKTFPIVNGEFNQVVEMVVQPQAGKSFVGAKTYRCAFDLKEGEGEPYHYPPEQGPPGPDLVLSFALAKGGAVTATAELRAFGTASQQPVASQQPLHFAQRPEARKSTT